MNLALFLQDMNQGSDQAFLEPDFDFLRRLQLEQLLEEQQPVSCQMLRAADGFLRYIKQLCQQSYEGNPVHLMIDLITDDLRYEQAKLVKCHLVVRQLDRIDKLIQQLTRKYGSLRLSGYDLGIKQNRFISKPQPVFKRFKGFSVCLTCMLQPKKGELIPRLTERPQNSRTFICTSFAK